jgi:hypothetical protein
MTKEARTLVVAVRAAVASMKKAGDGRVLRGPGLALEQALLDFDSVAAREVASSAQSHTGGFDGDCG